MTKYLLGGSLVLSLMACDPAADEPRENDFLNYSPNTLTGGAGGQTTTGAVPSGATTGGAPGATTGAPVTTTGTTTTTTGTTGGAITGETTGTTDPATTGGTTDGGAVVDTDAGTVEPMPSVIAGTYTNCTSYGDASDGMCAGYYCSVTAADIAAELVAGAGPCSNLEPERICGGKLTKTVGSCARSVKSNPLNALDSDAQLRVKVEACVFEDAEIAANVSKECASCFLDAAQCASDNCLTECLAGDSPNCDQCRIDNNCNQTVPTCGGLPSPF